jgi:hypothetical protein
LKPALAIACFVLAAFGACSRRVTCERAALERCESRCGSGSASRDTREGNCEGVLRDLCLAHCTEDCGGASADLAARVSGLEAKLDRGCGSGRPMAPEEHSPVPPRPTPGPLDQLLL